MSKIQATICLTLLALLLILMLVNMGFDDNQDKSIKRIEAMAPCATTIKP